jgi:hypothetical protein
MELINDNTKRAHTLSMERKGKRKLITERLRKSMKASDRNDWFNMIALVILLAIVTAGTVYYFLE